MLHLLVTMGQQGEVHQDRLTLLAHFSTMLVYAFQGLGLTMARWQGNLMRASSSPTLLQLDQNVAPNARQPSRHCSISWLNLRSRLYMQYTTSLAAR